MKKFIWNWLFVLFVAIGGAVALPALTPVAASAQSAPEGLNKLEDKLNDVAALIERILGVFVLIGALFVGFRFVQGDPNAWKYTMYFVLGATIIFASSQIVGWLKA